MYIALPFYFFASSIIITRKAILNITVLVPRFQIIFNRNFGIHRKNQ